MAISSIGTPRLRQPTFKTMSRVVTMHNQYCNGKMAESQPLIQPATERTHTGYGYLEMSVFVTVGTTQFEDLVAEVSSSRIKKILLETGYTKLTIQYGKGEIPNINKSENKDKLKYEIFNYKNSIADNIAEASLVISHAGAGSCLEVLSAGKPLIVVVNEKLMDNHQYELAEQLHKDRHLLYCTPHSLFETIQSIQSVELLPLPPPRTEKFAVILDNYFGLIT